MSFFESQATEDTAAKFRSQVADRASRYKKDSMPTKREIEFNFRGTEADRRCGMGAQVLEPAFGNAESERHVGTTPLRGMDLSCSDSRCLEHRLQFVERDDRSTQSRA